MTTLCPPLADVRFRRAAWVRRVRSLGCWCIALPLLFAAEAQSKKSFNIAAGEVVAALRQFATQSGAQVIFPEDAIEGTTTPAVKGAFTPVEAIERLLSGTNLKAARDQESGSFAVSRTPVPRKVPAPPNG